MVEFYNFNNVKVNNDKAVLIKTIQGKSTVIKVTPQTESIRFLGVWIDILGKRNYKYDLTTIFLTV